MTVEHSILYKALPLGSEILTDITLILDVEEVSFRGDLIR